MKHLFSAIWLLLFPLLVYAQVEVVLSDSLTGERISDVAVLEYLLREAYLQVMHKALHG